MGKIVLPQGRKYPNPTPPGLLPWTYGITVKQYYEINQKIISVYTSRQYDIKDKIRDWFFL